MIRKRIFLWFFIVLAAVYILPLVITFTNSFMSQEELARNYGTEEDVFYPGQKNYIDMALVPDNVTLSQYWQLLMESPVYLLMFLNSVKLVLPVLVGQLAVSSMAAYAFFTLRFRGKEILFFLYVTVMLLPLQVTMVANYIMADWLNITDGYLAIVLPGVFSPFGVFLLRQFMRAIPDSYIEAAKMDGAGHGVVFWRIVLPMVKDGLAAAAILTFTDYWNLVDQAVVFIRDAGAQPLSLFLASINESRVGVSFAGSCFYAIPILIVLSGGQEYLKKGILLSGLKG